MQTCLSLVLTSACAIALAAESLAAKLAHPHILALLDSGDAAGTRSARSARNESPLVCRGLYPSFAERTFFPVDWFNAVDTTYKADLRDLIEIQAQRFDARLEQRLAETRADLRTEMHAGFADLRTEIGQVRAEMGVGFAQLRAELIKWMFLFWLGTVAAAIFAR